MRSRAAPLLMLLPLALSFWGRAEDPEPDEAFETLKIEQGGLSAVFRDNTESPRVLSGVDSLFHGKDAPGFDAFDPDAQGASAGLNFEHVISGHSNPANSFTPRRGKYSLHRVDEATAVLARRREDDPWALSSTFRYTVTGPSAIDFDFRCRAHDPILFGKREYAVLFFADYMNDVASPAIHFLGVKATGGAEEWIESDAPSGHPDYNGGGTFRSAGAQPLEYDPDHNRRARAGCPWTAPPAMATGPA